MEEARDADAILLDSGNPAARVKELGGTGRRHDWALSAEIVARVSRPVFLAGGLTPENALEAIRTVQPWGLDICSGVRTDGRLDAGSWPGSSPRSGFGEERLRLGGRHGHRRAGTRPVPPRRRY